MKNNLLIIFTIACAIFTIIFLTSYFCDNINTPSQYKCCKNINSQEFFDKKITKSKIHDQEGHELILYEYRNRNIYSFCIEHSPTCKLCYEIYD